MSSGSSGFAGLWRVNTVASFEITASRLAISVSRLRIASGMSRDNLDRCSSVSVDSGAIAGHRLRWIVFMPGRSVLSGNCSVLVKSLSAIDSASSLISSDGSFRKS